jgi:hypothetical protein
MVGTETKHATCQEIPMDYRRKCVWPRAAKAVLISTALLAMTIALAGCSLFADEPDQTVADPEGLFHFKVPGTWQADSETGVIAVYASEDVPEQDSLDAMSILVLSDSTVDTATTTAERLQLLVDGRAESRTWESYETQEPVEISVGDRTGTRLEVSGVDSAGRAFEGAYHLVRTSGSDVLVVAISPADSWAEDREALDSIFEQWFWLKPEADDDA